MLDTVFRLQEHQREMWHRGNSAESQVQRMYETHQAEDKVLCSVHPAPYSASLGRTSKGN